MSSPGQFCLRLGRRRRRIAPAASVLPPTTSFPRTFATLHHEILNSDAKNNSSSSSSNSYVLLHGLLGNGKNLKTLAKRVAQASNSQSILVDLRGHGKSRGIKGPHNFAACVQDVQETFQTQNLVSSSNNKLSLIGHSWGGRIALEYAASSFGRTNKIQNLWLLDTVPGQAHSGVQHVLNTIRSLQSMSNLTNDRKELVQLLTSSEYQLSMATAQWLASSWKPSQIDGNGDFGFDMEVVDGIWKDFATQDFYGLLHDAVDNGINVNVVRGGKNPAWSVDILRELQGIDGVHVHVLPKAGHWVHVDDLNGLVDIIQGYSK